MLKFLAMNPNIVFSKEQLFEKIWGYDYVGDNATVMVHINRIREKIENAAGILKFWKQCGEQDTVLINKRCCFIVYESQQSS